MENLLKLITAITLVSFTSIGISGMLMGQGSAYVSFNTRTSGKPTKTNESTMSLDTEKTIDKAVEK